MIGYCRSAQARNICEVNTGECPDVSTSDLKAENPNYRDWNCPSALLVLVVP
jgi:hypothetical protein